MNASPRKTPAIVKAGYALKRRGELVFSWHRVRLVLTEREFFIHVVSERDFLLVGHMIDMLSGQSKGDYEAYRYDLDYERYQFLCIYFTWSVTGKKFGLKFDVLAADNTVKKSFIFCFDTEEEQDEWGAAFQKVTNDLRNSRMEQLTEANQSRRESVFNNISTLFLIAKNMKEEERNSPVPIINTPLVDTSLFPTESGDPGTPTGRLTPDLYVYGAPASAKSPYYAIGDKKYNYKKSYYLVSPPDEEQIEEDTEQIEAPYYLSAPPPPLDAESSTTISFDTHKVTGELGDFNSRFQNATKAIAISRRFHVAGQDLVKPYLDLVHLSQDFVHTAITYGKIIISEVYLPVEKKRIKPIDMGGYAGGLKFMVQNILFKFAIDHFNLYSSDDAAAKVAGHDLRGLTHYFECGIEDLCVPLTVLLDYRGFRLVCEAVMPISKDTIVYGSSNGGEEVHCNNSEIYEKLCRAAKMLNLKPHLCRNSKDFMLVTAIDLEGHVGTDNRYYLCDFSRAFPPERPNPTLKSAYLYRMLRPEFIRGLAKPLCSDAHSWFIQNMVLEKEHNKEVSVATNYLLNITIPAFAAQLVKLVAEALAKGELASFRLTPHLHSHGINVRHLGHLISYIANTKHVSAQAAMVIVHVEMVTRILKGIIRKKLRTKMKEIKLPLDEPYRCLLVEFLNLVFGASRESIEFWSTTMRDTLASKFCYTYHPPPPPATPPRASSASAPPSPLTHHNSSPVIIRTSHSNSLTVPNSPTITLSSSGRPNLSAPISPRNPPPLGSSIAAHPSSFLSVSSSAIQANNHPQNPHPSSLGPKSSSTPNLQTTGLLLHPLSPEWDLHTSTEFVSSSLSHSNSTNSLRASYSDSPNDGSLRSSSSSVVSVDANYATSPREGKGYVGPQSLSLSGSAMRNLGSSSPLNSSSNLKASNGASSPSHSKLAASAPLPAVAAEAHNYKHALFIGCPGHNGLHLCFTRLLEMTKMKLAPIFLDQFSKEPAKMLAKKTILHETDLLKIGLTTKQLNVVEFAQGFIFKNRGDIYLAEGDKETAKYFYNLAKKKYNDALHANPYNRWNLVNTAEVLTKLMELEHVKEEDAMMHAISKVNKLYMRAINMDQTDSYSLFSYANFLEKHTDNSKIVVEEFYLRSLENDPANCLCLSKYAEFLTKNKYPDADQFTKLAQQLSTQLLAAKDLNVILNKCRLDRTSTQIWQAKAHLIKADRTSREFLSSHRASRDFTGQYEKCAKCGSKFQLKDLGPGQCTHVGTWHNSFLDCNLDCVCFLSRNFSFGVPHWSCCYSINGTTTVCARSGPHETESCITPFAWDDEIASSPTSSLSSSGERI